MAHASVGRAEFSRLRRDIARIEGRLIAAERLLPAPPITSPLRGGRNLQAEGKANFGRGERSVEAYPPPEIRAHRASREASNFDLPSRGRLVPPKLHNYDRLPLGIPALDSVLGGGLPLATLHEIRAAESRESAAAAGFALALAVRLAVAGDAFSMLWVGEADVRRESGELYAPGLSALGLDPAAIVAVAARTEKDALWAFEAGLACNGLSVAICELRQASLDLTATRRCLFRARATGVTGLLLRLGGEAEPSAAELRFRLSAAPAATIENFSRGVGRMAWRLTLERNRGGRTGDFLVEWNAHERCFAERGEGSGDALPQPLPAPPLDRSDHPLAPSGAALRRAS